MLLPGITSGSPYPLYISVIRGPAGLAIQISN